MAKRKMTIPFAIVAPVDVLAVAVARDMINGNYQSIQTGLTGLGSDGKFHIEPIIQSYGPIAVGAVVHYAAKELGVNQELGRAGVPIVRV